MGTVIYENSISLDAFVAGLKVQGMRQLNWKLCGLVEGNVVTHLKYRVVK